MKGKLIKTDDEYRLYLDDVLPYATSDNSPYKRLSKQNCDEIFGIVDIDTMMCNIESNCNKTKEGFVLGFKMAMELNKDKKFTEVDMVKFADAIYKLRKENQVFEGMPELLQSLQQPTEIEVEIEMTCDGVQTGLCMPEICDCNIIPRLDEERCLILKRL